MLLPLSHMCGVKLMFFLFFIFIFFFVIYCFVFLCFCLSFFFVFVIVFILVYFLVIQSDLERMFKSCKTISHCKHVLIVKDYGKLGILYDEKLGGFIGSKKKAYPHNGRQAFSDPLKNECY